MTNYSPKKLLEYIRSGLVEQEHYGFAVKIASNNDIKRIGDDKNYPFYLRSCAKPLQASLLIDLKADSFYNMSSEEIAICCASHAGEPCHVNLVKKLLNKIDLDESYLKCGLHKPLSKTVQNEMLIKGENENILQNNCSGKHTMMLAICKQQGWDLNNYYQTDHPLQIVIKNKIYELCECEENYQTTKDGCGVPIYSMPLENIVKGYMNLFLSPKYVKIKNAFINNPYIIGGEDRLDTAIMTANKKLIAKVGAGGLCTVINTELKEGIIIKIMDCDMKARAIALIEILKQLSWLNKEMLETDAIQKQSKTEILTLHDEKIGNIQCVTNEFL